MQHVSGGRGDKESLAERLKKINVLIVISSHKAANLIERLFNQLGFSQILIAYDAAEAVQMLKRVRVHLLVADSELKVHPSQQEIKDVALASSGDIELSGVSFVRRLRNAPNSPAAFLPVLMLMDYAKKNEVIEARDAGVNEIVLKPMESRDFCERVIQVIDTSRLHITAPTYKGPCRRRAKGPPPGTAERRMREVRVIRCGERGAK